MVTYSKLYIGLFIGLKMTQRQEYERVEPQERTISGKNDEHRPNVNEPHIREYHDTLRWLEQRSMDIKRELGYGS